MRRNKTTAAHDDVSDSDDFESGLESYELDRLSISSRAGSHTSISGQLSSGHTAAFDGESVVDEGDYDKDGGATPKRTVPRNSASTVQSFMLYHPDEERAIIRLLDLKLVLFVAFLYMLSFLDRSNVGNAKVAGMTRDLHLASPQFEWLLQAFYITYIAFEWMTLLWKICRPHVYLTICVASWGLIASIQALACSFWSMLVLRACLGVGEAAFVGIPFFLSFFYRRDELAFRTGLFISAAPLATSMAGLIAWVISWFGDQIPIATWRVLFLVEGFPSLIVAVFVWRHIPDSPGQARYLTPRQREVAVLRLRSETDALSKPTSTRPRMSRSSIIRRTLVDPKVYLTASMFFCCNVAFSSLPVFLPTIIEEIGYSPLTSQALSTPPYLAAFMTVLATAFLSDRYRVRSSFVILHALLAASGYGMMAIAGLTRAGPLVRYLGVYPAAMGFFSAITIIITWTLNNQETDFGKGTGLSMLNYIGQLGPLIGVHLFPDSDGPYYTKGMVICACSMTGVATLALILRYMLVKINREADRLDKSKEKIGLVHVPRAGKAVRFLV